MNSSVIEAELGIPTLCFDNLISTNEYAKDIDLDCEAIITADFQSGGKGRVGKSFYSPEGGLYFSYVFKGTLSDNQLLTIRAANAVSQAIDEICGVGTQIKWVNDIYFDDRKVSGILCEATGDRIIVGIGINLNIKSFPEELENIAASLSLCDPAAGEKLIINIVRKIKEHPSDRDVLDYYRSRSYLSGKNVYFIIGGQKQEGIVTGIGDSGNLIVCTEDGLTELFSGEVSVRPLL